MAYHLQILSIHQACQTSLESKYLPLSTMKELLDLFEARNRDPHISYAVATVLGVEGASCRRPGARMLISANGRVAGSVHGGCLERAVICQGQAALLDGANHLLSFDITDQDDLALDSKLECRGKVWFSIEVLPADEAWPLEDIVRQVRARREPAALITEIQLEDNSVFFYSMALFSDSVDLFDRLEPELRDKTADVLYEQKTLGITKESPDEVLIEWLCPPISLVLFGAGADVPPMVKLASTLGHEVTVIDRRPDFAIAENFPGAYIVFSAKPEHAAQYFRCDERTAVVLMNHHYEADRDILASLVSLKIPYIALLGPKRHTTQILNELQARGLDVSPIEHSLHGPAGLDIGAETPEEVALAILAEIQSTLAGRDGGKLRNRKQPIQVDFFPTDVPSAISV